MNFYTYLQQHIDRSDDIGQLAREMQSMKSTEHQKVTTIAHKDEHKTWVNIVVSHATSMIVVSAFNVAWSEYLQQIEQEPV